MNIEILDKQITVEKRGVASVPMLVVGAASLFKKEGLLPLELYEHFTVYFADLFEKDKAKPFSDYSSLTLNDFVDTIEQIRIQLNLNQVVLLAHSANGVLALEYANQYSEKVLFNILIGSMPIWGEYRKKMMTQFFHENASENRKKIDLCAQSATFLNELSPTEQFIIQYKNRKAQFFEDTNLSHSDFAIEHLWDDVPLDIDLVTHYFAVINNYDLRLQEYNLIPTFVALGLYDASCPLYTWTDDIKKWFTEKNPTIPFETVFKLYIFESDHYLMSPIFNQAKPTLFVEKLLEYMHLFMNPGT